MKLVSAAISVLLLGALTIGCLPQEEVRADIATICAYDNINDFDVSGRSSDPDGSNVLIVEARVSGQDVHALFYDEDGTLTSETIALYADTTYTKLYFRDGPDAEWDVHKMSREESERLLAEKDDASRAGTEILCSDKYNDLKYIGEDELDGDTVQKFAGRQTSTKAHRPNAYWDFTIYVDTSGKLRRLDYEQRDPQNPRWNENVSSVYSDFGVENVITAPVIDDNQN